MTDSSNPNLPEDPSLPEDPATDPPSGGGTGGSSLTPDAPDASSTSVADTDPPSGGGTGG